MAQPVAIGGSRAAKDKCGICTIQLVFLVKGPVTEDAPEPYDEIFGFEPATPMGLVAVDRAAEKFDDGDWALTITFEGIIGEKVTGAVLEYDNSGVEDPIEVFERFEALADPKKYNARLIPGEDGQKEFHGWAYKIKDPQTGKMRKNPMFGVTHFLNNNTILRVTFAAKELKTEFLKNLCKIDVPQVPEGSAENIETPDGKNWLKRSVRANYRGNVWQITIEWVLGVWAVDIYRPNS